METVVNKNILGLREALGRAEDVARNIYYAMSYLPEDSPARENLKLALAHLGVKRPIDVGLSDRVLEFRK